jgi:hypothetical protein
LVKIWQRNANLKTYKTWRSRARVQQCPVVLQRSLVFSLLLVLLSIMLSRFSSLFIYAVAGLVISAAAKPMGHLNSYDDGPKPPSPPGSPYSPPPPPPPKYPADKPYAKPYPSPDNSYNAPSQSENNCNVGQQHCCNPINRVNHPEFITSDDSLLICCFRMMSTPTRVTLPCSLASFHFWSY